MGRVTSRFSIYCVLLVFLNPHSAFSAIWGSQEDTPAMATDSGQVSRGYIVPRAEPAQGGAKLIVDIFHKEVNSPVTLKLQAVVNDGTDRLTTIDLDTLSDRVADNPQYRSHREFPLDYNALNARLRAQAPNAPKIAVGPGTPLFVHAQWGSGHQWGGPYRSGIFYLPIPLGAAAVGATDDGGASTTRPNVLDIAVPISRALANAYNVDSGRRGLKPGGQVRSRVEGEGKFQIPAQGFQTVRKALFDLSKDPAAASQVLGGQWTIKLVDRYMQRNQSGQLQLDADGFPIPDPMVDTYYDDPNYTAAKTDMAIRYRWTQGNQTGAWNFKPGMGITSPEGVVYRVEYGVDTTDDKPESLALFADSQHPMNPFRLIRNVAPNAIPSQFLSPAVKLTDYRYKFELRHVNGLVIEVSLDDVRAEGLRAGSGLAPKANFFQLEMDIEHLATQSQNGGQVVAAPSGMSAPQVPTFLASMGAGAFFDGRPVLHGVEDLQPNSPVRVQRKADFDLAAQVIDSLRKHVIGATWIAGSQKYAFAGYALRLFTVGEASNSVKQILANNSGGVACPQLLAQQP